MDRDIVTPEVREVALTLMEGLNCPRALTVAILLRAQEWEQLFSLECNPTAYTCADAYLDAASATDFLRKLNTNVPGVDVEALAVTKWQWAEHECFKTNRRLNEIRDFGTLSGVPVSDELLNFIEQARKNLLKLVGYGPNPEFQGKFGPGATVSDKSVRTTVLHKLSSTPTLTPSALFYLVPWTGTKWAAASAARGDEVKIVRGNIYFTVLKTALARRSCAKEPSINVFYQLGLGREMRKELKRSRIDLDSGQNVHRRVACAASLSGEFCTIDLTSASDTLATSLVEMLLPRGWLNHLTDLRSPMTLVNGKWHRLEKFSSMGNGFTFELETAIFAALAMTCMGSRAKPGENMWVYGDDIIVPTPYARSVIASLKFFGFTPNERKTFVDGPFRESCGGDFFNGVPVRAHFLKELPYEPQQWISLANGLRRLALNNGQAVDRPRRLLRAWFKCLDFIPSAIRSCRGPEGLGDIVIHDDESRWKIRWRANGIRYVRVYRPAKYRGVNFCRFDPDVQFAGALYGVSLYPSKPKGSWEVGFDNRLLIARDGVSGYKVGWVPFS